MSAFCGVTAPDVGLQIAMANVAAIRDRALSLGVTTEEQSDEVDAGLRAALDQADRYEWAASAFVLDFVFAKPPSV